MVLSPRWPACGLRPRLPAQASYFLPMNFYLVSYKTNEFLFKLKMLRGREFNYSMTFSFIIEIN